MAFIATDVAGEFQLSVVFFAPSVAEVGYLVLPLRVMVSSCMFRALFLFHVGSG